MMAHALKEVEDGQDRFQLLSNDTSTIGTMLSTRSKLVNSRKDMMVQGNPNDAIVYDRPTIIWNWTIYPRLGRK